MFPALDFIASLVSALDASFPCSLGRPVVSHTFRCGVLMFAAFTARLHHLQHVGLRHRNCRSQKIRSRLLQECERPQYGYLIIQTRPSPRIESPRRCTQRPHAVNVRKGRQFGKYFFHRRLSLDWYSMTRVTSRSSASPWECGILSFHSKHCVRRRGTKTITQSSTWFPVSYLGWGPQ